MFVVMNKLLSKLIGRKYYKEGKCKGCGRCCENIYVNHGKSGFIKTEEEFFNLKRFNLFYNDLDIIGKDEFGLLFKCKNLDKKTMRCKIHWRRPLLCRKYPMEEIFKMGGILAPDCGYKLKPVNSFKEMLEKLTK